MHLQDVYDAKSIVEVRRLDLRRGAPELSAFGCGVPPSCRKSYNMHASSEAVEEGPKRRDRGGAA